MRVTFDISVLGTRARSKIGRTGVFRTVQGLLAALMERPDLDLALYTRPTMYHGTLEYLRGQGLLPESRPLAWARRAADLADRVGKRLGIVPRWAGTLRLANGMPLHVGRVEECEVFHSPWFPVPKEVTAHQRTRAFLTIHDLIPELFPHLVTEGNILQHKRILESVTDRTYLLCASEATRRDLLGHCDTADPEKAFVTHWAASELFHPVAEPETIERVRARYGIPSGPYMLSVSTLEPRKNIKALLHAWMEVHAQDEPNDLSLVLVGGKGWDIDDVLALQRGSRVLSDKVHFTGYVDDRDLAALYSGALAFIFPSLYEGFGLPPLEAMQCGTPVICSNRSSLPEVVGDAGLLVDPDDIPGMVAAIRRLYQDAGLREHLGKMALGRSSQFSWQRCAEQTVGAYRRASEDFSSL